MLGVLGLLVVVGVVLALLRYQREPGPTVRLDLSGDTPSPRPAAGAPREPTVGLEVSADMSSPLPAPGAPPEPVQPEPVQPDLPEPDLPEPPAPPRVDDVARSLPPGSRFDIRVEGVSPMTGAPFLPPDEVYPARGTLPVLCLRRVLVPGFHHEKGFVIESRELLPSARALVRWWRGDLQKGAVLLRCPKEEDPWPEMGTLVRLSSYFIDGDRVYVQFVVVDPVRVHALRADGSLILCDFEAVPFDTTCDPAEAAALGALAGRKLGVPTTPDHSWQVYLAALAALVLGREAREPLLTGLATVIALTRDALEARDDQPEDVAPRPDRDEEPG